MRCVHFQPGIQSAVLFFKFHGGDGIDCPEKSQPYGKKPKQAASALVFGEDITLQTYGKDKYGRTIADVLLPDGTNVNHKLVEDGWCWWYRKYGLGDVELEKLEKEARNAKKGCELIPSRCRRRSGGNANSWYRFP